MDSSWNQVGSGDGFSYYTPCIPIFGEQSQETEVISANHHLLCSFASCINCQPSRVCVQGSFPTPTVELVAAQVVVSGPSRRRSNGENFPRREKDYSIKEDELLCSAYINVGKDPIFGCNQPMGAYWDRVFQYYNDHKTMQSSRTKSSLIHYWEKIQRDTSKFCGFYDKIERLNESGKDDDDRVISNF
jgi:hypothetical protein